MTKIEVAIKKGYLLQYSIETLNKLLKIILRHFLKLNKLSENKFRMGKGALKLTYKIQISVRYVFKSYMNKQRNLRMLMSTFLEMSNLKATNAFNEESFWDVTTSTAVFEQF